MDQSPSWEANSNSASQEIPRFLWNPMVHNRVHKSPPLVPIMIHMHPVHNFPSHFPKIQFNIIFPATCRLGLPSCLCPSGFEEEAKYIVNRCVKNKCNN
jgi:hypothetical protein